MTGTFKCYCSKAERLFHTVGSSGSLGICRVRRLRAQRQARTGHTAVRWVHRCPGPALGSCSFESQVPLRSSGKLCTFGQMNPTQHVCLLCRPWDPTEDSPFWFIFLHFVVEEGKLKLWCLWFRILCKEETPTERGLEPSSQREIRLGLVHSAAPSCTGLSFHAAEGRVWVQKEFSNRKPIVSEWRRPYPKEGAFQWLVNSGLNFAG